MSVGAVGGVGMGGAGAMSAGAVAGAAGASGADAAGAMTPAKIANGSNPVTSIADLNLPADVQTDFNSIDLLIALLLMAAMTRKDDEKSAGSTAIGFLAGLAMAGALGRMDFHFDFGQQGPVEEIAPNDAAAGGQLNVTA